MRYLAVGMIAAVPAVFGFIYAGRAGKEYRFFLSLIAFFRYLLFQVKNRSERQDRIFASFSDDALEGSGFLNRLRILSKANPETALYSVLSESIAEFGLDKETESVILSFSENFGSLSLEKQISECEKLLSFIEGKSEEKKKRTLDREKLCKTVGISIGLGIAILFI